MYSYTVPFDHMSKSPLIHLLIITHCLNNNNNNNNNVGLHLKHFVSYDGILIIIYHMTLNCSSEFQRMTVIFKCKNINVA